MKSQKSKSVIKKLQIKYELTEEQILEIINSQFRILRLTIENCDAKGGIFKVIKLPKFGKFYVLDKYIKRYKKDESE